MRGIELHRELVDDVRAAYCGYNRMTQVNARFDEEDLARGPVTAENFLLLNVESSVRLYAFPLTRVGRPWIRLEPQGGRILLRAGIDYDGEGDATEQFVRREFASAGDALRAAVAPGRVRSGKHGWCSWYHYYTSIDEENLRENLSAVRSRDEMEVFLIDMGYCPRLGDWLEAGQGFNNPIAEIVGDISGAGKVPGVWLAPFTAEADSELYRAHPDWFYADDTYPWKRNQPPWKCMDLSVPEALDNVIDVVRTLHEAGARYLKLDFIDMALVPGTRRDGTKSGVELYRHALEAIRAAAPDSYILGCNPLISASVDVVDAVRAGEDTAPRWLPEEGKTASAHHALRTALGRTYLRQAVEVDLDCMILRSGSGSSLSETETDTVINAVIASGEQRFISDDMSKVDPSSIVEAFKRVPHPDRVMVPARPLQENEPSDFDIYSGPNKVGKLICNWGDGELCIVGFLAFGPEASSYRNVRTGEIIGRGEICLKPRQSVLAMR